MDKNKEKEEEGLHLVKVYVRPRPLREEESSQNIIKNIFPEKVFLKCGEMEKKYTFDKVFDTFSSQVEVYSTVVYPLINYVLSGYTCTVFAYGQTGTGKTYTMIGENLNYNIDLTDDPSSGMIPRAAIHLFNQLQYLNVEFSIRVSFVEIYNEEIRDLLVSDSPPLKIYDDPDNKGATRIKGITEMSAADVNDVFDLLNLGVAERETASTNLNRHSSRSHSIFTIIVTTRETTMSEEIIKTGKLNLVDLAGSENIGRSGAKEMRAREAGTINKSLLTLGKVIKALAQKSSHVPYRESKLTRVLQDSLGGKSKTSMIATFAPIIECFDETLSTLEYASVARHVANCPTVNISKTESKIYKELQSQIDTLRQELDAARSENGFYVDNRNYEKIAFDVRAKNERVLNLLKDISHYQQQIQANKQNFNSLNESFQKSKALADSLQRQLEETEADKQKKEQAIEKLNGKIDHLSEITNVLYNVCETSIAREDVYLRKYQNQCAVSNHNASVTRNIHSAAVGFLKEMETLCENANNEQEAAISESISEIQKMKLVQTEISDGIGQIQTEIQTKIENNNLSIDNLIKSSNVENGFLSQIDTFADNCAQFQLAKFIEIEDCIKNIDRNINNRQLQIKEKSSECLDFMQEKLKIYNEKSSIPVLENLLKNVSERQRLCQQKSNRLKQMIDLQKSHLEILEKKIANEEESECVQSTENFIKELEVLSSKDNINPLVEINQALKNFHETFFGAKSSEELTSLIRTSINKSKENWNCCENAIKSYVNQTNDYISEFFGNFESDLNLYNKDIESFIENWCGRLDDKKDVLKSAISECISRLDQQIQQLLTSSIGQHKGIDEIIQKARSDLKNLEKMLETKFHNGFTPQKQCYNYPRNLN